MSGLEGVGEWVSGEGGKAGVPCGSPLLCSSPPLWLSCTPHNPSFEGRRVLVVVLLLGFHLVC
jgi:hypothetical protein